MNEKKIAEQILDILPERINSQGINEHETSGLVEQEAARIKTKRETKEIILRKYAEKQKLARLEAENKKKEELAASLGLESVPEGAKTKHQIEQIAEQKHKIEVLEAIEAETVEPLSVTEMASKPGMPYSSKITAALQLQGASRADVAKLLTSLNINTSVQLSKQDTANLLASLLTCNETQLNALYQNKKVPIAIKTVIKRLIEDAQLGNIETIERLWDRIFGKGPMKLDLPEDMQLQTGIIPNMPISREAYVIIRDTLIK